MIRVKQQPSSRDFPQSYIRETIPSREEDQGKAILTVRSAFILSLSLALGLCAGGLTYLATVLPSVAILTGAIFAGCLACAGAVRLFNSIIR